MLSWRIYFFPLDHICRSMYKNMEHTYVVCLTWCVFIIFQWSIHPRHYDDVIMETIASQITSLTSVYSTVYSGADQSKHQSSASLAFVWGIHRGPVNSPHKWPVTRKMFPFDDVIMNCAHVLRFEAFSCVLASFYVTHIFHGYLTDALNQSCENTRAPSQYKDRLIYVWRFPCYR